MKFAIAAFLYRYAGFCRKISPNIDLDEPIPDKTIPQLFYNLKLLIGLALLREAHRSYDYADWIMRDDPIWRQLRGR